VLVAHLTDSPGWHVTVNGRAVPVAAAPANQIAVHLGAGRAVVALTYLPHNILIGLLLGLLAALGLAAWAVWLVRRRRRQGGVDNARRDDAALVASVGD
jgi:uncharacterized membrane protein YfhO